ncbi:hypothetical protein NB603_18765 [Vibrio antiquarius]|nr:hypothetical protein [Vibrio antiquarius]MCR9988628.1 hypothetical protein [Vibrio antiquarius]
MRLRLSTGNLPNKAFKRDLARVAFSVCVVFSGYCVMRSLLYCVPAPLNAALVANEEKCT